MMIDFLNPYILNKRHSKYLFILIYIFFIGMINGCNQENTSNKSNVTEKNNSQITEYSSSTHGDLELWLATYSTDDFGSLKEAANVKKQNYSWSQKKDLSLSDQENPSLDPSFVERVSDSLIIIASLSKNIIFVKYESNESLTLGCYSSILDKSKKVFLLHSYKSVESLISSIDLDINIDFSGIVCANEEGRLFAIASNDIFLEPEAGGKNLMELLHETANLKKKSNTSLQLAGFSSFIKKAGKSDVPSLPKNVTPSTLPKTDFTATKPFAISSTPGKSVATIPTKDSFAASFFEQAEFKNNFNPHPQYTSNFSDGSKFEVIRELGDGAFGKVFEVSITKNGVSHRFALKKFSESTTVPEIKKASGSDYFLKNYGQSPDKTLQLIELGGPSLDTLFAKQRFVGGPSDLGFLARGEVFHDLFDGLSVIHKDTGINTVRVHWDLKEANTLIGLDNRIKIIDTEDASSPTFGGGNVGTDEYMPPERLGGLIGQQTFPPRIGAENDVFAAGVMLLRGKYGIKPEQTVSDAIKKCCDSNVKEVPQGDGLYEEYFDVYSGPYHNALLKRAQESVEVFDILETKLIADMLNPNPKLRPTIEQVRARWLDIHPRVERSNEIAKQIFSNN